MSVKKTKVVFQKIQQQFKLPLKYLFYTLIVAIVISWLDLNSNIMIASILVVYVIYFIELIASKRSTTSSINNIIETINDFILFTLFAAPVSVYAIVIFASNLPSYFPKVGSEDAWITFAGTLIGGSLTIFALAFSISSSAEQMKMQRLHTIKPILKIDFQRTKANFIQFKSLEKGSYFTIKISCHSLFPAITVKFDEINIILSDNKDAILKTKKKSSKMLLPILSQGEEFVSSFSMFTVEELNSIKDNVSEIKMEITISFLNVDDSVKYKQMSESKLVKQANGDYKIYFLNGSKITPI